MPLIYTPTVGEACKAFSHIAREPKGFFITPDDRGRIRRILANWDQNQLESGVTEIVFEIRNADGRTMLTPCVRPLPPAPFDWRSPPLQFRAVAEPQPERSAPIPPPRG